MMHSKPPEESDELCQQLRDVADEFEGEEVDLTVLLQAYLRCKMEGIEPLLRQDADGGEIVHWSNYEDGSIENPSVKIDLKQGEQRVTFDEIAIRREFVSEE